MSQEGRVALPELQVDGGPETHHDRVEEGQDVVKQNLDLLHLAPAGTSLTQIFNVPTLRVTEGPEVTGIADWAHGGVPHLSNTDIIRGNIRVTPEKRTSTHTVNNQQNILGKMDK